MILEGLDLQPFGGLSDKQVEFAPGLNIIIGPNEAGKSTLVNAIFSVLFLPSNLRKNSGDWKDYLANYLPYPQGDTIKAALRFRCPGGENYVLTRCWGENRMDNLTLPQGSTVSNEKEIREIISPFLKYGRGTYSGVFLSRQEDMLGTVEMLRDDDEAASTLTDILRTVVLESGGVSVEKVRKKVEEEKKRLLSLWDQSRNAPKDGRGLDNPFKKGLGEIISAYYEAEALNRKIEENRLIESKIAEQLSRVREVSRETYNEENKVREMEKAEKDIYQRSTLEPQLKLLQKEEEDLRGIMEKWPQEQGKIREIRKWLEEKETERKKLEEEYQEAQQTLHYRKIREHYLQVKPLMDELKAREKQMQELPSISSQEVGSLEEIKTRINYLQSTLEAMKFKGEIKVVQPMWLNIASGLKSEEEVYVEEEFSFEAEGKFLLRVKDWTLQVQSTTHNVDEMIEEMDKKKLLLKRKLDEYFLNSIEEAKEKAEKRKELNSEIKQLQERIKDRLADMSFEKLHEQVAELPPDKQVRDPEVIKEALDRNKVDIDVKKQDIANREEQLKQWEEKYSTTEEVINKLTELRNKILKKEEELKSLAPLPKGYNTPEEFMQALRESRQRNKELRNQLYSLEKELVQLQNMQPEESTEEIAERLSSAQRELTRLKLRGRAVCIVEEEINNITQETDRKSFVPLADSFISYFYPLTNYRYNSVNMEGTLPESVASDKKEIPVDFLSIGTRRGLALALRLAMADYLWGEKGGFLVMDDPLVDLDPQRKKNAAEILNSYSSSRQLLIFTCDPALAELIGGKVIELA